MPRILLKNSSPGSEDRDLENYSKRAEKFLQQERDSELAFNKSAPYAQNQFNDYFNHFNDKFNNNLLPPPPPPEKKKITIRFPARVVIAVRLQQEKRRLAAMKRAARRNAKPTRIQASRVAKRSPRYVY